jgi:hypothetical protein
MKPSRPRYRFCWSCSRQLHGNHHRVVQVEGGTAIVHAECARRDGLTVVDGEPKRADARAKVESDLRSEGIVVHVNGSPSISAESQEALKRIVRAAHDQLAKEAK